MTSEKIRVTKNYSFAFRPHLPKCDKCSSKLDKNGNEIVVRCCDCKSARRQSEDKLRFVFKAINKIRNDIIAVRKVWQEQWNQQCKIEYAEANAAKESGDNESYKKLEKEAKLSMGKWIRDRSKQIESEIVSSIDWYYDHPAFSNYIRSDSLKRFRGLIYEDLKFKRFDGSGSIYIQSPGGSPVKSIKSSVEKKDSKWVQIASDGNKRTLRIKIAGKRKAKPIYADIDVIMHRELPEDGVIKGVRLIAKRVGLKLKYSITFSVEQLVDIPNPVADTWVAVKFGWSESDGVASAVKTLDHSGNTSEIFVDVSEDCMIASKISRITEDLSEKLIPEATAAIDSADNRSWPDWLVERSKNASQWKSRYKVIDFIRSARSAGVPILSDEKYRMLIHHVQFIANSGYRSKNKRKERANQIASELKEKYQAVILPDTNFKKLKEASSKDKNIKKNRERNTISSVSPGLLRERLQSKFVFHAFMVDIADKKLGEDTLRFMFASGEALAKGSGVLANVEKQLKSLSKRDQQSIKRSEGRRVKAAARKDAEQHSEMLCEIT